MHVQRDAAGSHSLLSIMRQVTALVRRRGKSETCGEHHFCVGSPPGRRRFPQKEDSANCPVTLLVWRPGCQPDERGSKPLQGAIIGASTGVQLGLINRGSGPL